MYYDNFIIKEDILSSCHDSLKINNQKNKHFMLGIKRIKKFLLRINSSFSYSSINPSFLKLILIDLLTFRDFLQFIYCNICLVFKFKLCYFFF